MAAILESVTIEQYVGKCKGVLVTQPIDWVIAHTNKGSRRVGLVNHFEGAVIRFVRVLPDDLREEIRRRVAELRKAQGGKSISDKTSSIPDPRLIQGFLRGEKFRKRKTVVSAPDGLPSAGEKNERKIWTPD
jgi:hypothetical protein